MNFLILNFVALLLFSILSVQAIPAKNPLLKGDITFPKESFDECFIDDAKTIKGTCCRMEECPTAMKKWIEKRESPKTCYFVKFDHFVCCEPETDTRIPEISTVMPPPIPLPTPSDPNRVPYVNRSSQESCYFYNNLQKVSGNELTFVFSVVGGMPTRYREYPFMAALGWRSNFDKKTIYYRCGGALISEKFVLTAAHCVDFGGDRPSQVRLGGDNLTLTEGEDLGILRIIVHPEYDSSTDYNDIALLELEEPAAPELKPSCLWYEPELANSAVTAIGYGQTSFAGLSSAQLLKVPLQRVSNDICRFHYSADQLTRGLLDSQLCAGDDSGQRDTCQGDSGGPLLMTRGFLTYVAGITSHGQGCASGPPTVYTRVSSFLDWIEGHVWPQGFQVPSRRPSLHLQSQFKRETSPEFDLRSSF
ncbi:trypsin-1-like [Drosophila bipectinata]|uniref:trypsin-1-like n=1 Tax=Drosophila bipectinata TaxID=42026 RepID=UPI001C8ABACF|nr:serine protease snake-like [Drosophila bipectinata]XP_017106430.2 serine protease snake-like [Drosophila bipectinata]